VTVALVGIVPVSGFAIGVQLGIGGALAVVADLQAQLAASLKCSASLSISPPTIALMLQAQASIAASLAIGLPSISLGLSVQANLQAAIQLKLALLLPFIALQVSLGFGGIELYSFNGIRGNFGNELGAAIALTGSGSVSAQGIALVVQDPAAFAALGKVIRVA